MFLTTDYLENKDNSLCVPSDNNVCNINLIFASSLMGFASKKLTAAIKKMLCRYIT